MTLIVCPDGSNRSVRKSYDASEWNPFNDRDGLSFKSSSISSPGDGKCDFISYYPFQETGINQDQSIMQVQIHTDQSSVSKHSLSDFMIATNSDITPSQNMVSMEYKHKLCKLKITIKPAPLG